jgi:Tfp pilus assembly pilus retraction ATPase PilT
MDMLPTLCTAMTRAGSTCLVLKTGEPPHVLTADGPQNLARAILSPHALETLISQIFSEAGRWSLDEAGVVEEQVVVAGTGMTLTARAHRHDDSVSIELLDANPEANAADAPPAGPDAQSWLEVTLTDAPVDAFDEVRAHVASAAERSDTARQATPVVDVASRHTPASVPAAAPGHGVLTDMAALAMSRGATALYVRANNAVLARVDERLEPLSGAIVDRWQFQALLDEFDALRAGASAPEAGADWTRDLPGIGTIGGQTFTDERGAGLMLRLRAEKSSPSLHRFIPAKVRAACDGDGLIVVSAGTAADLVAMGAAVGDVAGRQRGGYVIALWPAGSRRHDIAGAFVSQRELTGTDAEIAAAIQAAASESPDVLIVAPPAGDAAFREAVHAADGGRLVVLALLAPTSMQALRAVAGKNTSGGDAQTRLALATSFRAAFTYRSLRRLGGGRTLVRDVIVGTSEVSALLAAGDFQGVGRVQREGALGMATVDDALARAVQRGHLSLRQAAANAVDKRHLVSLVRTRRRMAARIVSRPMRRASDRKPADV